jgi:hypothetical protein
MHIKFISRVFEQYLFAYGDLLWGFAHEKFAYGDPHMQNCLKKHFSECLFAMMIKIPRTLRMASPPPSYPPFAIRRG